jgi:hypothetical protein
MVGLQQMQNTFFSGLCVGAQKRRAYIESLSTPVVSAALALCPAQTRSWFETSVLTLLHEPVYYKTCEAAVPGVIRLPLPRHNCLRTAAVKYGLDAGKDRWLGDH